MKPDIAAFISRILAKARVQLPRLPTFARTAKQGQALPSDLIARPIRKKPVSGSIIMSLNFQTLRPDQQAAATADPTQLSHS
ncbi:hypothetical protein HC762_00550 [bacterium]|nr:hypothetical protein [bacterium]